MNNTYLYLLLLAGTYVEGETAVITASFASSQQIMNFYWVFILSFFGTLFTDWLHFFIGRWQGRGWIARRPRLQKKFNLIQRQLENYPLLLSFFYRYFYGMRVIFPIAIGLSKIPVAIFLLFSAISTLIWTILFTHLGFYFGEFMKENFSTIEKNAKFIILTMVILGTCLGLIVTYFKNRSKKA